MTIDEAITQLQHARNKSPLGGSTCVYISLSGSGIVYLSLSGSGIEYLEPTQIQLDIKAGSALAVVCVTGMEDE